MLENFKPFYKTNSSGVYAVYLINPNGLTVFSDDVAQKILLRSTDNLIYIGKASNLQMRILGSHYNKARKSTLRRTLAELMHMNFIQVSGKKGLTPKDEEIITGWMEDNIRFEIYETPTPKDAEILEEKLIRIYQPPLNKKGCAEHF